MIREAAKAQWDEQLSLLEEIKRLREELKPIAKRYDEISKRYKACEAHVYEDGFCHKCGLPEF